MRKLLSLVIATLLIVSIPTAFSATPKVGGSCTKINQFYESKLTVLVCATTKGKKTWRKATSVDKSLYLKEKTRLANIAAAKVVPTPTPSPTPTPTPTPLAIPICSGIAKSEQSKFKVSIQLLDPFDKSKTLKGGAIFLKVNSIWTYNPANIKGQINIYVDPGNYEIDTLPPFRSEYFLTRKGFVLSLRDDGQYSISNSKLVESHCQISSDPSSAGLERFSEVKRSNYKFAIEPMDVQPPTSTVKYIAPLSNRQQNPIVLDLYPWESESG